MLLWAKGISALPGRDKHGETVHKTTTRDVLELIRKVVLEEAGRLGIRIEKIILFGSRARGDYREDSDWDILVVVHKRPGWRQLFRFQSRVRVRLFEALGREIDLIVIDKKWFEERKGLWGSLEHAAATEGVAI